jgi:hypothetical protein
MLHFARMFKVDLKKRHSTHCAPVASSQAGRCDEARAPLAEIYGWFTEGFDLPDLQEAKALLDELS